MNAITALTIRYPALSECSTDVQKAFDLMLSCYKASGKVLVCGNGGSAADADHIVGELLNKFKKKRKLDPTIAAQLLAELTDKLVGALPAMSLVSMSATLSSISNDSNWDVAFAQQVYGLGSKGDVLIAISTSGDSTNCLIAALVAHAKGIHIIALTGKDGDKLTPLSDVSIRVPETETFKIQELHLPIYHALCSDLEDALFN